jgi:hypothetical protein
MGSLELRKSRSMTRSRLAIVACVLALGAISAVAAPTAASSPSVRFDATLAGTATGGFAGVAGRTSTFRVPGW